MTKKLMRAAQRTVLAVTVLSFLGGCATASKDISATYVSPIQYASYDCQQIGAETQRLQARYAELGGRLDQAASNDKAIAGVGIVLFWPALFALGGTKQQEAEYARLRGEYDAVSQASVQKRCGAAAPLPTEAAIGPAAPTSAASANI
jgi:hypothetical protein